MAKNVRKVTVGGKKYEVGKPCPGLPGEKVTKIEKGPHGYDVYGENKGNVVFLTTDKKRR